MNQYIIFLSNKTENKLMENGQIVYQGNDQNQTQNDSQNETRNETEQVNNSQSGNKQEPFNLTTMLLIYGVGIAIWFFFLSKRQKKKEAKIQEQRDAIKIGDEVFTSAGFYGKVCDVDETRFVIEFGTNKGVRIPVRKTDVFIAKQKD